MFSPLFFLSSPTKPVSIASSFISTPQVPQVSQGDHLMASIECPVYLSIEHSLRTPPNHMEDDPMLSDTRRLLLEDNHHKKSKHHHRHRQKQQQDKNGDGSEGNVAAAVSLPTMIREDYPLGLYSALFDDHSVSSSPCTSPRSALDTRRPYHALMGVRYVRNRRRNFQSRGFRIIPQTPERILDAPDLLDDFYLNLIDWSSRNILAVALNQTVYLWDASTGDIQQLMATTGEDNIVTSVAWSNASGGNILAIGTNLCSVQLWETTGVGEEEEEEEEEHPPRRLQRVIEGHAGRVGSLSWNTSVLASGSRDTTIMLTDALTGQRITTLRGTHTQEVCGLRWSTDGTQLASGGNDNLLVVWDYNRLSQECRPRFRLTQHTAAVKALAWNPTTPHLLASGGGTADKTLRFWDTHTGRCLNSIDTRSQVCAIVWCRSGLELVTSHGYSENQLVLWKYPSLKRLADLTGHTSRVLHLALSPDGQLVVSAAGDETVRFWKCFQSLSGTSVSDTYGVSSSSLLMSSRMSSPAIRHPHPPRRIPSTSPIPNVGDSPEPIFPSSHEDVIGKRRRRSRQSSNNLESEILEEEESGMIEIYESSPRNHDMTLSRPQFMDSVVCGLLFSSNSFSESATSGSFLR